jgi:hypothetical protein
LLGFYETHPDVATTVLTDVVDAATGQVIADEPSIAERGLPDAISAFANHADAAAHHRVGLGALGEIAQIEQNIAAAVAPLPAPEVNNAPWLDYRPSQTPPRPWSGDDFERDARRMSAAQQALPDYELSDLTREVWTAYAELGRDPVTELINEQRQARIDNLLRHRETVLAHHQAKETRRRDAERVLQAELAERQRIERDQTRAELEARMAQPHLSINGKAPWSAR